MTRDRSRPQRRLNEPRPDARPGARQSLSSEPHACRCKGLFDGFLDLVKGDSGNRGDHEGNRAGEQESFHGGSPLILFGLGESYTKPRA